MLHGQMSKWNLSPVFFSYLSIYPKKIIKFFFVWNSVCSNVQFVHDLACRLYKGQWTVSESSNPSSCPIFWEQHFFLAKNFCNPKNFWFQIFCWTKNFLIQNYFWIFENQKCFWTTILLTQYLFWTRRYFGPTLFWSKIFYGPKFYFYPK